MEVDATSLLQASSNIQQWTKKADSAAAVREAVRHLWQGYRASAWGSDEVRPISGGPGNQWGGIGMAIIDTMDTLWLADMHKEFDEGQEWISKMKLDGEPNKYHTSFFEVTIRGLGGLLSCYSLSGRAVFMEKAKDLGSHLLYAFPQKAQVKEPLQQPIVRTHVPAAGQVKEQAAWPAAYMDIRNPSEQEAAAGWLGKSILADVGSNVLEFAYLSQISGDPRYKAAADGNELELVNLAERTKRHLMPKFLDPLSHMYMTEDVSIGAFADSYFEYLLKGYLQSGGKERRLLGEWKKAMQEMKSKLLRTSKGGYTFLATDSRSDKMDHLSCFMGGLLVLGSHYVPAKDKEDWWLPTGAEITRTCYEMYRQSPSGLAAESSVIGSRISPVEKGFRVRPETLESLFYLYRITGDEKYRQWSSEIFDAINKHTRTKYGFANVKDVTKLPVTLQDSEETFVGAETLKYALLIHLPAKVLPLDKYVLNTEAHPLPITKQQSSLVRVELTNMLG